MCDASPTTYAPAPPSSSAPRPAMFITILGVGLMLACGVVPVSLGAFMLREVLGMRASATGIVVGSEVAGDAQKLPIVTFTTAHGEEARFVSNAEMGRFLGPRIGDMVPVRYDERRLDRARIDTFRGSFQEPVVVLLIGVAPLAMSVSALLSL
jgi:hypothetical protein